MYKSPLILGIDADAELRKTALTLEQLLQNMGGNTGNLIFSESLYSVISGAQRSSYHFDAHELEGRDAIVVAAANWLNPYSDFGWLADRLEKLNLPVILVGIGAQATLRNEIPCVKDGTVRLLKLASERSNAISTRGHFSNTVVESLGIKNTVATGCPSLMLIGERKPKTKPMKHLSPAGTVLHGTRHQFDQTDDFQTFLYREGIRISSDILLQSELADMYYATGRTGNTSIMEKVDRLVTDVYGTTSAAMPSEYLSRHGKVPLNFSGWMSYIKTKEFCVGTRIHGTIAALIAGTPATLIAHDSRTLEMAKQMHIPYVLSDAIDTHKPLNLEELYKAEQLDQFSDRYCDYYTSFANFFQENGLTVRKS